MNNITIIQIGNQRAKLYPEGGISYESHVKGIGWCIEDEPDEALESLAERMQRDLQSRRKTAYDIAISQDMHQE